MEPQSKRKPGRQISFSELQSPPYAIAHFPPRTPNPCMSQERTIPETCFSMTPMRLEGSLISVTQIAKSSSASLEVTCLIWWTFWVLSYVVLTRKASCLSSYCHLWVSAVVATCWFTTGLPMLGCTPHIAQILPECSLGNAETLTVESVITTAHGERFFKWYKALPLLLQGLKQPYFQVTSKTIFSVDFLEEVSINLEISWVSFESRANVYNEKVRWCEASRHTSRRQRVNAAFSLYLYSGNAPRSIEDKIPVHTKKL